MNETKRTIFWMALRHIQAYENVPCLVKPEEFVNHYWPLISEFDRERILSEFQVQNHLELIEALDKSCVGYKLNEESKISDIDFTLIRSAILYAMNRQTIASAMLPDDITKEYFELMTKEQKQILSLDLRKNLEQFKIFGSETIDHPKWMQFLLKLENS
jgi:hypothetical protein